VDLKTFTFYSDQTVPRARKSLLWYYKNTNHKVEFIQNISKILII